ncbi:hypothetical protein J7I98_17920 [Streptomyces sp. ISL-98]|uniref:hypothetical protein n=1 Tax=Streptomyces sp. ISL-98 TaxID=2819192 RepID=UPI001BEBCD81|nr:hypothetical protein [Streptomyces sp. ISL-98]MBT2507724.1 hypothetical protein [Streptomyces sp. ISL-98]
MADEIHKIVTTLPDLKDVTGVWAVAERRLAQGDGVFLADLGVALAVAPDRRRMAVLAATDTD